MSKIDSTIQRNDEEFLNYEVSDQALEAAVDADGLADYTYYGCTYGYCPSY